MTDRLQRLLDSEKGISAMLVEITPAGHKCGVVHTSKDQWDGMTSAFDEREAAAAALMPTEQDAIDLMHYAYQRLKGLGWNDPIYCPKDGSSFDVIEAGSTGIHSCSYWGDWPTGSWMIDNDYPSHPVLYRVTEAELAQREQFRQAVRAQREVDEAQSS